MTVTDDELASTGVTLRVSPETVAEGAESVQLVVTGELNGAPAAVDVEVTLALAGETAAAVADFVETPGVTLTIAAGSVSATAELTLQPVDDRIDEGGGETVTITASTNSPLTLTPPSLAVTITDDDERGLVVLPASVTVEEGMEASYTVALATRPTGPVTVRPEVAEAGPVTVVSPTLLTFLVEDWNVARTVTVAAAQDDDAEDELVTVTHAAAGGDYAEVSGGAITVIVTDDDEESTLVRLSVEPAEVPEDAGERQVRVTATLDAGVRTSATDVAVTVVGDTAQAADFAAVTGFTIRIPAGQRSAAKTFMLTPLDDRIDEGRGETVTVGGSAAEVTVRPATLTIVDDDERGLVVLPASVTVEEGMEASYTVALATRPTGPVTVRPEVAEAGPVTVVSPTLLTFLVEDWNVARTVTVAAAQDDDAEGELVTVTHAAAGGDYAEVSGGAITVIVTDDDEESTLVRLSVEPAEVPEDAGERQVRVTATLDAGVRTSATDIAVTVVGDTAQAADFAAVTGFTIRIPAGQRSAAKTFMLTPLDDRIDEGRGETVTVGGSAAGVTVRPATLTIVDDDERGLVLGRTVRVPEEGSVDYSVALSSQPTGTVTVRVEVTGGDDVTVSPDTLIFTESNWDVPQTVTVEAGDDPDASDETVMLRHEVFGADYGGVEGGAGTTAAAVTVTVTDNDTPATAIVLSVSTRTVREGAGATELTVTGTLEGVAETDVAVTLMLEDGTARAGADFEPVEAVTLVIPAGAMSGTARIGLRPVDDAVDEGDETVRIVAVTATSLTLKPSSLEVTIADDDVRGLVVSRRSLRVNAEGMAGYTVALASEPTGAVMVSVTLTGPGEVTVAPSSVVFTAADWNVGQSVTVRVPPELYKGNERATVAHTATGADYAGISGDGVECGAGLPRGTGSDARSVAGALRAHGGGAGAGGGGEPACGVTAGGIRGPALRVRGSAPAPLLHRPPGWPPGSPGHRPKQTVAPASGGVR